MDAIEKRIEELEHYRPELTAGADLERFWSSKLELSGKTRPRADKRRIDPPMRGIEAFEVVYRGYDQTPIHAWYLLPESGKKSKHPCIVVFPGYRSDRGYPEEYAQWLLLGLAVLAVDVRGQGGRTGNLLPNTSGTSSGWTTQGILDKSSSYYLAVYVDCLRAVDWLWEQPEIDRDRICAGGPSQGGGLALAVAALSRKTSLAIADIPNMCHLDYGILHSNGSPAEIADFLNRFPLERTAVLETLSYFDNMNLAQFIRKPVVASVCLKDQICPPETVYAAYNRITAEKEIHVYPFEGHVVNRHQNRQRLLDIKKYFAL